MARVYINTVCFKALLLQLCALSALGQDFHVIPETNDFGVDEYYYDYTTDIPAEDFDWSLDDWLYELMDVAGNCDPNPCLNSGSCSQGDDGSFICLCPDLYSGKKCQTAPATPPTIHELDPTPAKPDVPAAQFSQCGRPGRSGMIIRGLKSPPGANPWQVSLQTRSKGSSGPFNHMCGGILLESCWVLTAAHCIISEVEMQVVLGGVDLEKDEIYDQVIPVEKAIVHENYQETPFALYNDIAMLQLKVMDRPYCAKETRYVKTACLPNQPFNSGTECVISGWGATEKNKFGTNKLMQAPVLLISQEKCKAPQVYGDVLDDSMFCAGYLKGGVDSCKGDSGGPLVCQRNGTHYVVGAVSWGDGCGLKNKPGVYANVGRFVDWITHHLLS